MYLFCYKWLNLSRCCHINLTDGATLLYQILVFPNIMAIEAKTFFSCKIIVQPIKISKQFVKISNLINCYWLWLNKQLSCKIIAEPILGAYLGFSSMHVTLKVMPGKAVNGNLWAKWAAFGPICAIYSQLL